MKRLFSARRLWAIIRKEFLLMRRDPAVIIIMAVLPIVLVYLAGYVVNTNPKHAPTAVLSFDHSDITRDFLSAMENTQYFSIKKTIHSAKEGEQLLQQGKVLFVLTIPAGFTRELIKGARPNVLLESGAIDPVSSSSAFAAMYALKNIFWQYHAPHALNYLTPKAQPFNVIYHRQYNPTRVTQYSIVPGMMGIVLMLTILMITTVVAFRDIQGGTLECLLASPTRPAEILFGEIIAYMMVAYIQLGLSLLVAVYLFHIPFAGSLWLLLIAVLPYFIAEFSLGLTIATFCSTQFQAVQIINVFIAISVILTGFAFPIFGMPHWAQVISEFLPLSHFLSILRGIMLKGNDFDILWQHIWPLLIYCVVMLSIALLRFQRTLK